LKKGNYCLLFVCGIDVLNFFIRLFYCFSFVHYEDLKAAQDNNEGTITWSTAASGPADDSMFASTYTALSHSTLFRRLEYLWMLRLRPIVYLALCLAAYVLAVFITRFYSHNRNLRNLFFFFFFFFQSGLVGLHGRR
jgi:hypothetical protein